MTIENEYGDTQRSPEAHEYRKTTSAMLKGFAGLKFQKSSEPDFPVEIIATSPEVLDLAKQAVSVTDDIENAYWALAYQLYKSKVPVPKVDDIARTSIGSVTGGQVPKRKLPEEVQEGLDNMDNIVNRLSPGQPEAQIRTRGTFNPQRDSRGYTDQNQPAGTPLNPTISQINQNTAQLGRTSNPQASNVRASGGTNPSFSTGRGDMGETAGREVSYDQRASLPYESISQKPGDARTTYKTFDPRFNKSEITVTPESGSMETPATQGIPETERMLTKSRRIQVGENISVESKAPETETTFMIKHMIAGTFKEIHPFDSMREEDEALSSEAASGTRLHTDEEARLDEMDEAKFEESEALADEMEKTARKFELAGNWLLRDQAYAQAKAYRAQAQTCMKRIAARHGNQNIPTGL